MSDFTILDLLDLNLSGHNDLKLKCIAGRKGLVRKIKVPHINRPGLALSGFYENFAEERIQLFGKGECAYLNRLTSIEELNTAHSILERDIPCCIYSYATDPEENFLQKAEELNCPVLQTPLSSADILQRLIRALREVFAPKKVMHGVQVEVSGLGILILGDSGVGKSETALALVEKGHRLIADDAVQIKCVNGNVIMGSSTNSVLSHHMEIRGLGIINIKEIFGIRAIMEKKQVQLVVKLEDWDSSKNYDRIGSESTIDLLGVKIPLMEIPVKPGRNIPTIIETAALNEQLKSFGHNASSEFNKNIVQWLEHESARTVYMENTI